MVLRPGRVSAWSTGFEFTSSTRTLSLVTQEEPTDGSRDAGWIHACRMDLWMVLARRNAGWIH